MCNRPLRQPELVCIFISRQSICAEPLAARNIAEQLIEKGFATAVRHKRDDEDRSPEYDKLMAAEQA